MLLPKRSERVGLLTLIVLVLDTNASSQELVIQTLDRVQVHSIDSVLEMEFSDPKRATDFTNTGIAGSAFRACKLTALDGLYCLDGQFIRNWPDTEDPSDFNTVIDCDDPGLNLDARTTEPCTGLTVDSSGSLWIAGKNKRRTHSLIKSVKKSGTGSCPPGFVPLTQSNYCADEVATGRPLLVDINSVDSEAAEEFPFGQGILGLEERKSAVFFPEGGMPIVIASGKSAWNLVGNEQLLDIAMVQVANASGSIQSHVLVTTSIGRVLAINADGSGSAVEVFDIAANRVPTSVQCDFTGAGYGIRASAKSGLVYVTDRQFCEVVALMPITNDSGQLSHLAIAQEPIFDAGVPVCQDSLDDPTATPPCPASGQAMQNLRLSTSSGSATYPPEAPTVAPGIGIDLDDCAGSCTLVVGSDGNVAASLSNVSLASQESGMTLFQIKNIPDCRYVPQVCRNLLGVQDLVAAGVILDLDSLSPGNPAAQLLNLTKLLPTEITDLFAAAGGLPDMLMSRQYRGQRNNDFTFEAFFGVTEDGVIFRDTFNGEFDVDALSGTELGCELNLPADSPLYTINEGQPNEETGTLNWDIVTTVSENFVTFTDPDLLPLSPQHVDTLSNNDCGSSRTIGSRWSLKPYNLEVTPCTWNGDPLDVWVTDGNCPVGAPETPDDAVLAKLLLSLYDDLGAALNQVACVDVDSAGGPPLSGSNCATLNAQWLNGKDKLDKCWSATQEPKQSSGDQNCQAFVSQLTGFRNTLAGVSAFGPDPANRRGELRARVEVIFHLYEERFTPSIPAAGFVEP